MRHLCHYRTSPTCSPTTSTRRRTRRSAWPCSTRGVAYAIVTDVSHPPQDAQERVSWHPGPCTCAGGVSYAIVTDVSHLPQDAQERVAMHVRRSRMLDRLVVGQSMETGTRLPKTPTGPSVTDTELNQLGDVCPVELVKAAEAAGGPRRVADVEKDKPGDEAWRYRCAQSVADTAFYACADDAAGACAGVGLRVWRAGFVQGSWRV